MAGYCVVTDSRKMTDEVLVMVDRSKQQRSFWSNKPHDALIYKSKEAADRKAASLKYNNPRVLTEADMRRILNANPCRYGTIERELYDEPDIVPEGWDEHKDA